MDKKFEIITSQRGGHILIHNGYVYNNDNAKETVTKWRCRIRTCNGYLHIINESETKLTKTHNHNDDQKKIVYLRSMSNLKKTCIESKERSSSLIANQIKNTPDHELINMPNINLMRDVIKKTEIKKKVFLMWK